jgi:hypothetical protein
MVRRSPLLRSYFSNFVTFISTSPYFCSFSLFFTFRIVCYVFNISAATAIAAAAATTTTTTIATTSTTVDADDKFSLFLSCYLPSPFSTFFNVLRLSLFTFSMGKLKYAVKFPTCIQDDVMGSNLGRNTSYAECFFPHPS